jgi:hypothetical protein
VQNMQVNTPIKDIGATLEGFADSGFIKTSYRDLAARFFQALGMSVEESVSLASQHVSG